MMNANLSVIKPPLSNYTNEGENQALDNQFDISWSFSKEVVKQMPAVPSDIRKSSVLNNNNNQNNMNTESSNHQQIVADNTLTLIFDSDEDANPASDAKIIPKSNNESSFVSSSFRQD